MINTAPSISQKQHAAAAAAALGLVHGLVDMASLAILYREWATGRLPEATVIKLIILYNWLAFAMQAPLGLLSDRFQLRRTMAAAGVALTMIAIALCGDYPIAAAITVAFGNAMFHVGAGAIVLENSKGGATWPGVFVAPGAAGVYAGIQLGLNAFPFRGWVMAALAGGIGIIAICPPPMNERAPAPPIASRGWRVMAVVALMISIAVRYLIGGAWTEAWSDHGRFIAIALVTAAFIGKAIGGFLADRIGWRWIGIGALAAASSLIGWAMRDASGAIAAMLLLQLTMPVTLAAIYRTMPRHAGSAFGLASLALVAGSVPSDLEYFGLNVQMILWPAAVIAIAFMALALSGKAGVKRSRINANADGS